MLQMDERLLGWVTWMVVHKSEILVLVCWNHVLRLITNILILNFVVRQIMSLVKCLIFKIWSFVERSWFLILGIELQWFVILILIQKVLIKFVLIWICWFFTFDGFEFWWIFHLLIHQCASGCLNFILLDMR
jgi:hypothetical protein